MWVSLVLYIIHTLKMVDKHAIVTTVVATAWYEVYYIMILQCNCCTIALWHAPPC